MSPFIRYALTGGLATALHYALLLSLVEGLGWPAAPAATVGALAGAVLAYAGNRYFTFDARGVAHVQALPRFALVALVGALLNGACVWGLGHWLGLHYLLAQMLATLMAMIFTYRLNRAWSFAA